MGLTIHGTGRIRLYICLLNCNMAEVTRLKEVVEIPVVCAGRMQPDEASASISEGKLDAMGIGRQFLADPEYIVKLEQEKFSDILPCIAMS